MLVKNGNTHTHSYTHTNTQGYTKPKHWLVQFSKNYTTATKKQHLPEGVKCLKYLTKKWE